MNAFKNALVVLGLLAGAGGAQAQARPRLSADYLFRPGNVALTLSAGGSAFTDFQQDPRLTTVRGTPIETSRRISAQTTGTVAAGLALWAGPHFAFQVEGSFTPSRFRVITETDTSRDFEADDTTRYARLDLWNLAGNVLLRPPVSFGRVAPYAILGAGATRYEVRDDLSLLPAEAEGRFDGGGRTQLLVVIGAGAVIPLQRKRLLLSFDITDHLTQTPLADRARGDGYGTDGIRMTSNVRVAVGLTIPVRLQMP
jgi:hypothetical protein